MKDVRNDKRTSLKMRRKRVRRLSGNRSLDDLLSLPFVVHARTPQPKRRADDASFVSVREAIDTMRSEIIELAVLNASKQQECHQLEGDLGAVTDALNGNFSLVQQSNEILETDNKDLEKEISEKQELLETAKDLFLSLTASGIDLRENELIDYDYFYELLGEEIDDALRDAHGRMDSRAAEVVQQFPYFKECRTDDQFLDMCRTLVRAVAEKERNDEDEASESDYDRLTEKLKQKFQDENAKISIEIRALRQRREAILQNKDAGLRSSSSVYARRAQGCPSPIKRPSEKPIIEPLTPIQSCLKDPGTPRQNSGRRIVFTQNP